MGFHAGTPNIYSTMYHMQITGLSSVLSMDIRIVSIKIMKIRHIIMQALVHKNTCHIYINISY